MNGWGRQNGSGYDPWDRSAETGRGGVFAPENGTEGQLESMGSYALGVLGALLGAVVGALPTLLTGLFGFVSGWLALLIPFGARKGYRLFRGARKSGYAFAVLLVCSLAVSGAVSAFLTWPYGVREEPLFFLIPILFSFFGVLACRRGLQSYVNPALLENMTRQARQENREVGGTGELYIAKQQWIRPLKASILLSLFSQLAFAILLLILAMPDESMAPVLAAMGAMLGVFLTIFFVLLPFLGLVQPSGTVYIRTETGKLWRVLLAQLNQNDTYRFTHKSGALRLLTWDRLDEDERERAKANIRRAMADVESGAIYPGSILSMTVMPMEDLEVFRENEWRWRVRFRDGGGKRRSLSIPKAYPGMSLTSGGQGLNAPVPFRWSLLLTAIAIVVLLAVGGYLVGLRLEQPHQPIHRAAATTFVR